MGALYVLIGKEISKVVEVPEAAISLIKEFGDVFSDELPEGLPQLREIKHQIELEPRAMYQTNLTIG